MSKHHFQPEPSNEVYGMIAEITEAHHPVIHQLAPALNLGVLMVTVDDTEKETALKRSGWPCAALIKIVNQRDRAAGGPDVLLQIDGDGWLNLDDDEKRALLDHELLHIEFPGVIKSPEGQYVPIQDNLSRPIVKLRQHDFQLGGFFAIVERHGDAAIEKQSVNKIKEKLDQMSFPSISEESLRESA
jgi:Putative phage metallopeptidase